MIRTRTYLAIDELGIGDPKLILTSFDKKNGPSQPIIFYKDQSIESAKEVYKIYCEPSKDESRSTRLFIHIAKKTSEEMAPAGLGQKKEDFDEYKITLEKEKITQDTNLFCNEAVKEYEILESYFCWDCNKNFSPNHGRCKIYLMLKINYISSK